MNGRFIAPVQIRFQHTILSRIKHVALFEHYVSKARGSGKGMYSGVPPDPSVAGQDGQVYVTETGENTIVRGVVRCEKVRDRLR